MGTKPVLRFREDGTFKIVQIADLHVEEEGQEDARTFAVIEAVLESERPDLVVFTGDAVKGNRCSDPLKRLLDILELPEKYAIPYAFAFGNHDSENDVYTRGEMMDALSQRDLCLAEAGPDDVTGVGNYVMTVAGSAGQELQAAIYVLDTGCAAPREIVKSYAWLERNQIDWYIQESGRLTEINQGPLPAVAFFHIPLPEYNDVWDFHLCRGGKNENVGCPRLNTGMFAAMKQMGDIMGTFVGHDHTNDYGGDLYGIQLYYGRAGGFNTVGEQEFTRGARVIQLREGERGFDTWLRLADGSVVSEQPEHVAEGRKPPVPRPPSEAPTSTQTQAQESAPTSTQAVQAT